MGDLFLTIYGIEEDRLLMPVETGICLLVYQFLDFPTNIQVHFIISNDDKDTGTIEFLTENLNFKVAETIPRPSSFCLMPVFNLADGITCVAGLCSVLRQMVKQSGDQWRYLLGFREACLVACAEVSIWTKFCEVDMVLRAKEILKNQRDQKVLPEELARFEAHLNQPIRVHNVRKFSDQSHKYAEGPLFLLTDLILIVPVFILMAKLNLWSENCIPRTAKWAELILDDHNFRKHVQRLKFDKLKTIQKWTLPIVEQKSLYKRDPTRYKPRHKIFTQQTDIDNSMDIVSVVEMVQYSDPFGNEIDLPSDIPLPDVPKERAERKMQQLMNLSKSVLKVAKEQDIIVDFCSGSGHLGFILAHCLPNCTVVLLDNKEASLDRARDRLAVLKLNNVYIVQANLDYFCGKYQVGVALHACGVSSDLVIHKCLMHNASLVVCPCCYGGIQSNHIVSYPLSPEYKQSGLTERGYIVLGHCADQAGSEQGEKGMHAVDTDRCLLVKSRGYKVTLAKLIPATCTTRNNLIVAVR